MAAYRFAKKYDIETIPLAVAMTVNYKNMSQARRITYASDAKAGFLSNMAHLKILCDGEYAPYHRVSVLPHLDHADPARDFWALTEGVSYLSSVMLDMQAYSLEDNIYSTKEYVKSYGQKVLIEGVMEELAVEGVRESHRNDDYVEKAVKYCRSTGVDFLVADLGTEQQSSDIGNCRYLSQRAIDLTKGLGKPMLVLHGTSCLTNEQMQSIADDGIVSKGIWRVCGNKANGENR